MKNGLIFVCVHVLIDASVIVSLLYSIASVKRMEY